MLNLTVISTPECRELNGDDVHDSHLCTLNKAGEGACYVSLSIELKIIQSLIEFFFSEMI